MAVTVTLIPGLAILLFLPGFLFLRLLRSRGRSPRDLPGLEWLFVSVLISVLASSWIGLILAQIGVFSLPAVLIILLLISALLLIATGGARRAPPRISAKGLLFVALFAAAGFVFYSPPYEYVLGNWDPGTYVNAGAHLANEGSILIYDEVLEEIPTQDRSLFYYTHLLPQRYEGGMAIADTERGIVSPHFYHLYTVWIALFHALAGVGFALRVNAFFALLAVAAIYLAAVELAGRRVALLSALFVAISAVEIWNARFPTSEIITQFLLWSGMFCLFRYLSDRSGRSTPGVDRGFWAILAGLCFAEALLTRITAIIILPPLALIFFWRNWGRFRRGDLLFCLPLAAGLSHLGVQNVTVCSSYFERQVEVMRSQGITPFLLLASAIGFILVLALSRMLCRSGKDRMGRLFAGAGFQIALGALLVILFIFAYCVWPLVSGSPDARNLRELGWFVYPLSAGYLYFPLGLCIALAGALLFIRDGFDERRGSFFLIVLLVSLPFLYKKMVFPSYLWAVRRYVPLVFPSLIFFMAFCLARVARRGRLAAAAAALAVLLLMGCMQVRYVRRVLPTDFSGTMEFLDRLSSRLDRHGLYVCEGSGTAAPLDFLYGLDVLQLSAQTSRKCRGVEGVMERRLKEGRPVYYISRGGWPISRSLNFVPISETPLETDYLEHSVGRFPRRRNPVQIVARVFRVETLGKTPEGEKTRRLIDIGEDCFGLIRGFHSLKRYWEEEGGKRAQRWGRWTSGEAGIIIPTFGSTRDIKITLLASAGSKRPGAPVPVDLLVDGKRVARVEIDGSMEDHEFVVPASVLPPGKERAALTIRSPVWDPAAVGLKGYPSDLGIYVDRLLVEAEPQR